MRTAPARADYPGRVRAIQMTEFGGPEVLALADLPRPEPAAEEVLIRVSKAGLNFATPISAQTPTWRPRSCPWCPGPRWPVCGRTPGSGWWPCCGTGGYAEYATAPQALTFAIPDGSTTPPHWR